MSTYFKKKIFLNFFILFSFFNFYFVFYSAIANNTSKLLTNIMPKILNYSLKIQAPVLKNISLGKNNNNSFNSFSPNNINYLQNMNIGESFKNILVNEKSEELPEELKKEREEILKELSESGIYRENVLDMDLVSRELGLKNDFELSENLNNNGSDLLRNNINFKVDFNNAFLKMQQETGLDKKLINVKKNKISKYDLKDSNIFEKFNMDNSPFAQMIKFNFLKSNAENSLKELSENFKSKNNLVYESLKLLSEEGYKKFIDIIELKTKELNDLKNKNQELNKNNEDNKLKKDQLVGLLEQNNNKELELNKNNEDLNSNIIENNKKLENQKIENEQRIKNLGDQIQEKEEKLKISGNVYEVQEVVNLSKQIEEKTEKINLLKQENEKLKLESEKILNESKKYMQENNELDESLKDSGDAKNQEDNILRMQEELKNVIQNIKDKNSKIDLLSRSEKEQKEKVESIIKELEENKVKIEGLEKEIKQLEEDKNKFEENEKLKNKENQKLAVGKLKIQEGLIEKINKYSLFLNEYNSIIENIKEIYNLSSELIPKFKDSGLGDLEKKIELRVKSLEFAKENLKNKIELDTVD